MLKDPSAFRIGLMFTAAWAIWFGSGMAYAASTGSITSFVVNLPESQRVAFFIWILVSSALFGRALYGVFLGITGRPPPRP